MASSAEHPPQWRPNTTPEFSDYSQLSVSWSECLLHKRLEEVNVMFTEFVVTAIHHETTLSVAPRMKPLLDSLAKSHIFDY